MLITNKKDKKIMGNCAGKTCSRLYVGPSMGYTYCVDIWGSEPACTLYSGLTCISNTVKQEDCTKRTCSGGKVWKKTRDRLYEVWVCVEKDADVDCDHWHD
mmetsp:Transcript_13785/g.21013  ORF Transcript_13785/g.21013 Transcript_13785/m.21013 type:complete len:101 (-) Transcript_13785:225-527(-)